MKRKRLPVRYKLDPERRRWAAVDYGERGIHVLPHPEGQAHDLRRCWCGVVSRGALHVHESRPA